MKEESVLLQENAATNLKIEILKTYFPAWFDKDGKLLIEKLQEELIDEVDFSPEKYSLQWLGKSYASALRNEAPKTWIKPDIEFNSLYPQSENFLIKGDNLEVLKHLKNAYEGKVKMIYIDPPYNTGGGDFVYNDDRRYTVEELESLSGMDKEGCKKILEYYSKNQSSHSAWLTFMYPRLALARNLLREDGVIFISIDDNEQANLKILCDEIFGEENFVSCFVWQKKSGGGQAKYFYEGHEYILIYAKNKNGLMGLFKSKEKPKINNDLIRKVHGKYSNNNLIKKILELYPDKTIEHRNLMFEELEIFLKEKLISEKKYAEIKMKIDSGEYFLQEYQNTKFHLICSYQKSNLSKMYSILSGYWTSDGNEELETMFGSLVFTNPKPTKLLKELFCANTGEYDIILDFFAGSGTTAQAVMELNAKDGGNRKFILVQLDEEIAENKEAYDFVKNILGKDDPKISDITQERIIRAKKKILENYPDFKGDLGFQIFDLSPISDDLQRIESFDQNGATLFFESAYSDLFDYEAILQTFKLYDGIPLDVAFDEIDLGGYSAYKARDRIYFVHQGFETKHLQEFLRKIDEEADFCVSHIVVLAYSFESARLRELDEAINYVNKKSLKLELLKRY